MDLNIRVCLECAFVERRLYPYTHILTSRFIGRAYFSHGTAGTCTFSKNHSRTSVAIPVYRPIGTGLSVIHFRFVVRSASHRPVDAPDFYESSFWKDSDPESGLGGWGDPNADYRVPDGGFSGFHLSYPSSHTLRRNFTLRPYNFPSPLFPDPTLEANASFSAAAIETVLVAAAGDFKRFQVALETFQVSAQIEVTFGGIPHFDHRQGAHSAVHEIMGG
jgi:hypothetical protein